ncbi:MAG: hypothetical protein Q8K86_08790, partial [Candidatus Nanopelagicaceae bacterium]|nr:hypothetical protein [Candidatus Nanopelagicaceae bacterium]
DPTHRLGSPDVLVVALSIIETYKINDDVDEHRHHHDEYGRFFSHLKPSEAASSPLFWPLFSGREFSYPRNRSQIPT